MAALVSERMTPMVLQLCLLPAAMGKHSEPAPLPLPTHVFTSHMVVIVYLRLPYGWWGVGNLAGPGKSTDVVFTP
jgi:hypothetical protein